MPHLQAIRAGSGDGGNRTRAVFPPSREPENPLAAGVCDVRVAGGDPAELQEFIGHLLLLADALCSCGEQR